MIATNNLNTNMDISECQKIHSMFLITIAMLRYAALNSDRPLENQSIDCGSKSVVGSTLRALPKVEKNVGVFPLAEGLLLCQLRTKRDSQPSRLNSGGQIISSEKHRRLLRTSRH